MKRLLSAALVLAAVGAACSRASSTPDPITVGAVYPLSGPQAPSGRQEYRGVRLAVDMVNEQGGVNGRQVALRTVDVPGADAVPTAIADLHREGVQFVLGSHGSTISLPAAELSARRGMLFWETGAVGEMSGVGAGRLVFRVAPSGWRLGRTAVDFVVDRLARLMHRPRSSLRFAVAAVNDVYGLGVARGAIAEIGRLGLTYAGEVTYDGTRLDAAAVVHRLAALHPTVMFAASYVRDGVAIRRETVRQHLHLITAIGTSSSYCMPAFGRALGKDAVGLFASDKPDAEYLNPNGLTPAARDVLEQAERAYKRHYGGEMEAPALAGFAAAWALFHVVMPRARDLTPLGVASAARAVRLPIGSLPNGSGLEFGLPGSNDAGANIRAASVIWEWTGVGHRVVVWPPRFATAPIRPLPIAE